MEEKSDSKENGLGGIAALSALPGATKGLCSGEAEGQKMVNLRKVFRTLPRVPGGGRVPLLHR